MGMYKPTGNCMAVVNFEGLALSEFRKITRRQIEIGLLFVNCAPIYFQRVYFVNVPWWIRLIKALIPKKHLQKIRFVSLEECQADLGVDNLPTEIGGNVDMSVE